MDVATVQTAEGKQCYMTLLGNWGIMADIDIESESMRKLGEARLTLCKLCIEYWFSMQAIGICSNYCTCQQRSSAPIASKLVQL